MKHAISTTLILFFGFTVLHGQSLKDSLYVFVGKKISVEAFSPKVDSGTILMDEAFHAKYLILENLFGKYKKDTIEFDAYDHYGKPAFSNYENVLLFVSSINGSIYHEKYLFFDVYLTSDNKWASSYKAKLYIDNPETKILPKKIKFNKQIAYDLKGKSPAMLKMYFPSPYYVIKDNKAIAIFGNYIDELFQLEKETTLKARGIF